MAHYRKNYLCICEGQQEKMYLEHVAGLLKEFPRKVIKFNTYIDNPHRLTKTYEEYDSAALFDFDFNKVEFERNIEICDRLKREHQPTSRKKGRSICHAYSSANFDLWLILHKEDFNREVSRNDAYISDIRRIYELSSSCDIKSESVIKSILTKITLLDVKAAIQRAEKIRNDKLRTDANIVGTSEIYSNPDFSIHEFLKTVLEDSGDL
ncbi:RloB family protein [Dethiobacter alkaliphilus]|uniref:RloB family protein n=1 Tax=Dethiobacter alkaliphilus TaxID=427926 RepID=UPI0022269CDC|nr:RloB family protein [Dethiobacter alkaliphilus]MCW3488815.1 RloB family protein [Dethiobacter alkaliphilus]